MAFWTVVGTGIEGDLKGKSFGLTLDTDDDKWVANGPSVDKFFISRDGEFKIVGVPENGTQLVNRADQEAGFLTNLNGTTAVGATGTGRASEKGVNFSWKLDSK